MHIIAYLLYTTPLWLLFLIYAPLKWSETWVNVQAGRLIKAKADLMRQSLHTDSPKALQSPVANDVADQDLEVQAFSAIAPVQGPRAEAEHCGELGGEHDEI